MVDAIPLLYSYFMKYKNDMHAPAALQKPLTFELSKLRFQGYNLFQ